MKTTMHTHRCNKPATHFSVINGFRTCPEHFCYGQVLPPAHETIEHDPANGKGCDQPMHGGAK